MIFDTSKDEPDDVTGATDATATKSMENVYLIDANRKVQASIGDSGIGKSIYSHIVKIAMEESKVCCYTMTNK